MADRTLASTTDTDRPNRVGPLPRAVCCVVLASHDQPAPEALLASFRVRGVEVSVETEPLLALAELGRCLIEHRQQAAHRATFNEKAGPAAGPPHPSLILVIVEPAQFDDLDELIGCVAHSMPLVTISAYQADVNPSLRVLQHGRAPATAPSLERNGAPTTVRPPRHGLGLADSQRNAPPGPAHQPTNWPASDGEDIEESEDQSEVAEALISQAELAMLLGDDYGFGADDEERGS